MAGGGHDARRKIVARPLPGVPSPESQEKDAKMGSLQERLIRKKANHEMKMQLFLAHFICLWLGFSCLAALAIFFLQGFHAWGFRLETGLMHWVGVATVGALAGLAGTVYAEFFKRR
jgi:hypothetical protein